MSEAAEASPKSHTQCNRLFVFETKLLGLGLVVALLYFVVPWLSIQAKGVWGKHHAVGIWYGGWEPSEFKRGVGSNAKLYEALNATNS